MPLKGIYVEGSPRSALSKENTPFVLSPESDFFDLIIDGTIDTSIEQMYLYRNVCEMQSSADNSPSRLSFISYGEESRIDSELQFLAGMKNGESRTVEKVPDSRFEDGKAKNLIPRCKREKRGSLEGYLGPYLLKQARDVIMSGGNHSQKALELAIRAMNSFEASVHTTSSLPLVMCLHVVAALHCRLGDYDEAIRLLERSIEIPTVELGLNHAMAKFAGCMQLGDTYAALGWIEKAISLYSSGLEIQRRVLGEDNSRFGNTCRYLAEAYVQALQFDEAEQLCSMALEIHVKNRLPGSVSLEEAEDRQLMGLIFDAKGEYDAALKHFLLAKTGVTGNVDLATVECNIGEAHMALGQYDEALLAYQTALKMCKSSRGGINHSTIASILICLAELCRKTGNIAESKSYCDNAIKIYSKRIPGMSLDNIVTGLVEASAVYSSINEFDRAIEILQEAINVCSSELGNLNVIVVAGIEAQMGALYYITERFDESYHCLKSAIGKIRTTGETKRVLYGMALNQMGLACLRLMRVDEAKELFDEVRSVLEGECGTYHADTLGIYGNLAGTYDAMGRVEEAIEMLKYVVEMREKRGGSGKGNPGLEEMKWRLAVLVKEQSRK